MRLITSRYKTFIILSFIYTLVLVYLLEFVLVMTNSSPEIAFGKWRVTQKGTYDHRSKLQVVEDLRKNKQDAWPLVTPSHFIEQTYNELGHSVLPLAGLKNVSTVFCNEAEGYAIYTSDEKGFRNKPGVWNRKNDLLLIGDSFVQGACVEDENTIASRLQSYGNALSLGQSGTGPLVQLALLKEYSQQVNPKTVLWFYFEANDQTDLLKEQEKALLISYLRDGSFRQNLLSDNAYIQNLIKEFVESNMDKVVAEQGPKQNRASLPWLNIFRLNMLRGRLGLSFSDIAVPDLSIYQDTVAAFNRFCIENGFQLFIVYVPTGARYQMSAMPHGEKFSRKHIINLIAEVGVPIVDFHKLLISQNDPRSYYSYNGGGHLTSEGYQLLADYIIEEIETHSLHLSREIK